MTWIKTIKYDKSNGMLRQLYNRIKGPGNNVDNIMKAHSLRPHTMKGHMALYKNVLHHRENTLPKSLMETIGVYVSRLNGCDYCVDHHIAGLKRLLKNDEKADEIRQAIESGQLQTIFDGRDLSILKYAKKLSTQPSEMTETDIQRLKSSGLSDGEILEVNQVVSYFHYANRTVLGLGVTTEGDILGLSPNEDDSEDNWTHK